MKKIAFLLLFIFTLPAFCQQEFEINLSTKGYSLINIAVDRFKGNFEKREDMRQILIRDLKLSGIFSPIKDYAINLVTNEKENRCKKFLSIEAKILVEVEISMENNMLVLYGKVTDLESCKMIFKRQYKGSTDSQKELIHTFADDIVFAFTGTRGISNTKIAFVSDRTGHREVFIMDYNGDNIRQLTKLNSTTLFPAVSPDRKIIAFTSYRDNNPDLFLYFLGGKIKRIYHAEGIGSTPDFSPDGKLMVFSASKNGNTDIYLFHIDSGEIERLTKSPAIDTSPKFSPNGKAIVFTSDRYGSPQIYTMTVEGLNITKIRTVGTYNDQPCWSPDGKYIAYSSMKKGKFQIYLYVFATGENIQLTRDMGSCENPVFSPDSRRIAFQSNKTGKYQIYSMNINGSNVVKLTSKGNNTCPYWVK
ncbi:TolB protein [Thermotomaculum hydrothermale]|uniref:TolB protein n=1 Tax=Thermotomaculum hydrothermale TaxID=981385 RepID=A0A7R6PVT9_9BACT|nr:PD40 domain-containing protein [Thermotomaculum hydrothermale]BBB33567.1 TolB protein [Thermotomaculum hydrothermale]